MLGWNVTAYTGNPTRSIPVNRLIKDVLKKKKKAEVQRQGKRSCTRRPLEYDKFEKLVKMIGRNRDPLKKYSFIALVS